VSLRRRQARQSQPTTFAGAPTRRQSFQIAEHLDINIVVDKHRRKSLQANLRQPFRNLLDPVPITSNRRSLSLPVLPRGCSRLPFERHVRSG
jgi:hypothetical protein